MKVPSSYRSKEKSKKYHAKEERKTFHYALNDMREMMGQMLWLAVVGVLILLAIFIGGVAYLVMMH